MLGSCVLIASSAELAAAQAFSDAGMELGTAQLLVKEGKIRDALRVPNNVYNAAMNAFSFAKVKRNARMSSTLVSGCLVILLLT
jgi:hypothetical protein